ncbi:TRAP transporter substrate-binding protein [Halomonas sp. McH1-25]|uniref:TRAP transporter substrate-binding protein n=1 Tax=unclassified Halomonas TaxID=2609666 RepID=UPI001EF57253|nr:MULTISPECIES: TRAP transporter substrate-binding protein [unclassified Halomonas]MCG7602189.1 TRAP transporter substrate-binding protein [Halomonas sp. McH1-25]MCP1344666.1 TRAP transporter substrate-binding protein [Halomonas sp. FL8]MCP1362476.1 TRAP transporter substrate-binding protein [Halomonas sp. BBD45]MCP1364576.1 TRAP transporter substrate-binding protein [Halomonas sp. BBD48]
MNNTIGLSVIVASLSLLSSFSGEKNEAWAQEKVPVEPITLSYAFFAPADSFPAVQMKRWANEVNKRTEGRVEVALFPGGSLLTAQNMYDGVLSGVADIGLSATSYEPGRFPLFNLAGNLTGQGVNSTVASQVAFRLTQEFEDEMPGFEGFKVVTAFTSEPAYIQTLDPVRTTKDLEGLDIRISGGNSRALEALGASAVGMSQAETSEALQSGVIDGYAASREVLMDMQFARMIGYVTDYPLTNTLFAALMTREKWESLPEDVQEVINDLGPQMASFTGEYLDEHISKSMEWAQEEEGVEIINLSNKEQEQWDEKLATVNGAILSEAENKGLPAKRFAERMYEMIKEYQTP